MEGERDSKKVRVAEPLLWYNLHEPRLDLASLFTPAVSRVILTTMVCDMGWLLSAMPLMGREVLLSARDELPTPSAWTFVKAPSTEWGVPHGKLMVLLEGREAVTVVVTSANLCETDYSKRANAFWWQRFVTLAAEGRRPPIRYNQARNDFGEVLLDYLTRLGLPSAWTDEVARFDCSAANVALVSSVPGVHGKADAWNYGQGRMRRLLQIEAGPGSGPLYAQVSSVGRMTTGLCTQLGMAFGGPVSIVWPSVQTVRIGQNGYEDGLHICLNSSYYSLAKRLFAHQYVSRQPQCSPHIKTFFRLADDSGSKELQFLYLGSHNLSKSAWGEKQAGTEALQVFSFEIGVVFFARRLGHTIAFDDFALPYQFPAVAFGSGTEAPWVWDVEHQEPDVFGQTYKADKSIC